MRTAEHLVVRRHDVDLARRAHPQLDARAAEVLALDALLDDAALLVERREVLLDVDLLVLELDRRAEVAHSRVEVEQRVPETAHAQVELEDRVHARQGSVRGARRAQPEGRRLPLTSSPTGWRTSSSANTCRLPVFEPSQPSAGSQP